MARRTDIITASRVDLALTLLPIITWLEASTMLALSGVPVEVAARVLAAPAGVGRCPRSISSARMSNTHPEIAMIPKLPPAASIVRNEQGEITNRDVRTDPMYVKRDGYVEYIGPSPRMCNCGEYHLPSDKCPLYGTPMFGQG